MAERRTGRRALRRFVAFAFVVALIGMGALVVGYVQLVHVAPGEHIARTHILSIISRESPVYYRDGVSKVGVFFDEQHRLYLPFGEIPACFVDALVAAEDQDFFRHHGFSVRGISRAAVQNVRAGRVVAGGSTLTQQTAKNLFGRKDRSLRAKLDELLDALRLEAHHSKEDILEFYANQFYVNGNGRGLGIAARYFFDKPAAELGLAECAFLAGVVKGPERYNPFVADPARRARAEQRAAERVAYVTLRMVEDGKLTAWERDALLSVALPFQRGHFRYERSVALDAVEAELTGPELRPILAAYGIDDPGKAGLSVVTTLDRATQEGALYALRHQLTEVGAPLEGLELGGWFWDGSPPPPLARTRLREHAVLPGVLVSVDAEAGTARADVGGVEGLLDKAAQERLGAILLRAKQRNVWAAPDKKSRAALLVSLQEHVGRSATFSVRGFDADGGPLLDWEADVELEGGIVAIEDGRVRAMVGGASNADWNRASQARRQLGSTWKMVLFEAALQLRWSALDPLDNRRAVFPYQGTYYYPRPDHADAPPEVSMAWAAAKSENLASIHLLDRLTDPLNDEQFRQLADALSLYPPGGLADAAFVEALQREGVLPTAEKRREGLYQEVRDALIGDLLFEAREDEARALRYLPYGLGFGEEVKRVASDRSIDASERKVRQQVLARAFTALRERLAGCLAAADAVRAGAEDEAALAQLSLGPDGRVASCGTVPDGFVPLTATLAAERRVAEPDRFLVEVRIDGILALDTLAQIDEGLRSAEAALPAELGLYDWDSLRRVHDFRVLISLRYLEALARRCGVASPIEKVMSLPLGSSDITLLEAALLYEAMLKGETWRFAADPALPAPGLVSPPAPKPTSLVSLVRDVSGTVIFQASSDRLPLHDAELAGELGGMLRGVVRYGTGRKADAGAPLLSADPERQRLLADARLAVPLFGKTGTTNSYKNSAFVGYVPSVPEGAERLRLGAGMVIATYVGYDDNREMVRGGIRIAGASGSLPAWIDTAEAAVEGLRIGDRLGVAEFAFAAGGAMEIDWPDGVHEVTVDAATGLPTDADGVPLRVRVGERRFAPFAGLLP